jgi:hypothetical protein
VRNILEHTEVNRKIENKLSSANQNILELQSKNKIFQESISEFEKQRVSSVCAIEFMDLIWKFILSCVLNFSVWNFLV